MPLMPLSLRHKTFPISVSIPGGGVKRGLMQPAIGQYVSAALAPVLCCKKSVQNFINYRILFHWSSCWFWAAFVTVWMTSRVPMEELRAGLGLCCAAIPNTCHSCVSCAALSVWVVCQRKQHDCSQTTVSHLDVWSKPVLCNHVTPLFRIR